jgi:hypothetical protein
VANYRQATIEGTTWTRAFKVVVNHPVQGGSSIEFHEEQAIQMLGNTTTTPSEVLTAAFDPEAEIEVLDPSTGEPTGMTISEAYVYAALYSKYIAMAKTRDRMAEASAMLPTPGMSQEP